MNSNNDNIDIAVSYSRKINHSLYGGSDYESSDHFCSISASVPREDFQKEYRELRTRAKLEVDQSASLEIESLSGGLPKKQFDTMLTQFINNKKWGTAEDYEMMSPTQQDLFQIIKRAKKRKVQHESDNSQAD